MQYVWHPCKKSLVGLIPSTVWKLKYVDVISKFFYDGQLKNSTKRSYDQSIYWIYYNTNKRFPNNYGGELYNPIEIDLINSSIESLNIEEGIFIVIITPYKKQKSIINSNEKLNHLNIAIDAF